MNVVKDQAICIGQRVYSESSQIVTFFGRCTGKIRAIAKGSRRQRGKFSGGIDLLCGGEIVYVPPRPESTLATLTEFTLQEPVSLLRTNLIPLHLGQYMAAMTGEFTEDFDPHEQLYETLSRCLDQLQHSQRPEAILVSFELALLREVGLEPRWGNCCGCGRKLADNVRTYFSSGQGGMICRDCEGAIVEKRIVEPAVWQVLLERQDPNNANPRAIAAAHDLLAYHQRELLGKQSTIMKLVHNLLHKQNSKEGPYNE